MQGVEAPHAAGDAILALHKHESPAGAQPGGRGARVPYRLAAATVVVGILAGAAVAWTALRDDRPNVVLVLVDALRRDHVGAYGHDAPTTPFLDSLARTGVVFENAWSHAPQTFNSTATLFTSSVSPLLLTQEVSGDGPSWTDRRLADENETLADAFLAAGWETVAVLTNPHHAPESGFTQGFRWRRWLPPSLPGRPYAVAPEVNRAFRELLAEAPRDAPLFAYVHYMDVHNPYRPPAHLARQFVTVQGEDRYRNGPVDPSDPPSVDDVRFMMQSYDACIRWVDEHVRELADMVRAARPGRPTILVVTSDHGDEFLEHGGLGHGHAMYPELLRVPLIAHGGALPSGVRVETLVRAVDVGPTLAALAGIAPPAGPDGRNLLPLVRAAARGEKPHHPPEIPGADGELPPGTPTSFAWHAHLRSLTTEDFELTLDASTGRATLVALARDGAAGETRTDPPAGDGSPRLTRLARRNIKRAMRLRLEDYERRLLDSEQTAALLREDAQRPDAAVAQQLRALGYVE